jgi:hypothetical protein
MKNAMQQALMNQKGKALDITIVLGNPDDMGHDDENERQELDLAPDAPPVDADADDVGDTVPMTDQPQFDPIKAELMKSPMRGTMAGKKIGLMK